MGFKTINGRQYYYRSERDGGRVRTSYVGAGDSALLFAALDAERRSECLEAREEARAKRKQAEAEEKEIAEWFARIGAVADAALIAAGYHKHKRSQWRRRRDVRRSEGNGPTR